MTKLLHHLGGLGRSKVSYLLAFLLMSNTLYANSSGDVTRSNIEGDISLEKAYKEKVVSGTVVDEYNLAIPGVSIIIKGTTTGTVTNVDGEYSINVSETDILVFSLDFINGQIVCLATVPIGNNNSVI